MYNIWSNSKMKKNIFLTICLLMLTLAFQSCDKEDTTEDTENIIEYVIKCDNPDAEFVLYSENPMSYHKGEWIKTFKTKSSSIYLYVGCRDEKALISVTLYVNGKKVMGKKGYDKVFFTYPLKKDN